MKNFMNPTAASVYCMQRCKDTVALAAEVSPNAKIWDLGYCRVLFDDKHCVRVVNRQGATLGEAKNLSLHQVYAFILSLFW